ncbi:peptidoglycan binding domain-containing protein [[Ruminococcus] gnavus]|uniref:L,D-transpeptidase family protein n=1 Tax=Mediterraneibacter gnavus TaxID=33038 RepID=UPI0022860F28|nr:peptidoglycan binding domain-containing protein [Mediterraneibacter gnavus]MCZ0632858.1 peptidoglycan binding domain-containing protein [Mediterraneibacter gnavus]
MGKAKKIKAVKRRKTGKDRKVKALWIIGGVLAVICLIYVAISVYFMSHFFVNTKINGKNFSGKTASDVEKYLQTNIKDYKLTILENEGRQDVISGSEIGLEYRAGTETEKLLKDQNGFAWPKAFFTENSRKVSVNVSYNEESLNQRISQLSCLQTEQTPAENAKPEFDGNQYVIKPEVYGNAVDKERLTEQVKVHITEFQPQLDMVETKCYAKPKYVEDSKEVQEACDAMNKYVNASITYPMNEPVVVDKALISQWLQVDGEMKVSLNTEAMKQWFTAFGDKYDTQGTTRTFTTLAGKSATVTGGTYGWSIDEDTELVNLQNSILNGEVVTREPAYYAGGTAAAHSGQDWGNTYAEVDMSAQHMWYIQNGQVVLETDVVTGEPIPSKITPEGVYSLMWKQPNSVLVGDINPDTGEPAYRTKVKYWMQVTSSGVGFHDAIWQTAFGGTLYQIPGTGSHGCINMPLDQAGALFNMIEPGTPVIFHW